MGHVIILMMINNIVILTKNDMPESERYCKYISFMD